MGNNFFPRKLPDNILNELVDSKAAALSEGAKKERYTGTVRRTEEIPADFGVLLDEVPVYIRVARHGLMIAKE
jgi:hypothetical protein